MAKIWTAIEEDVLDRKATEELRVKQLRVHLWEKYGILKNDESI